MIGTIRIKSVSASAGDYRITVDYKNIIIKRTALWIYGMSKAEAEMIRQKFMERSIPVDVTSDVNNSVLVKVHLHNNIHIYFS